MHACDHCDAMLRRLRLGLLLLLQPQRMGFALDILLPLVKPIADSAPLQLPLNHGGSLRVIYRCANIVSFGSRISGQCTLMNRS